MGPDGVHPAPAAEPLGDTVERRQAACRSVHARQGVARGEGVTVGAPLVAGALVTAKVRGHGRADKIRIVKFRRRKHHRKEMGHRQHYTEIEIVGITGAGSKE